MIRCRPFHDRGGSDRILTRPMIENETRELNLFGDVHKYPLLFAVGAPIVGSILQVWIWWSLFRIPEGTAIRPMLQSMQSLMVDAGAVLLGAIGSLELALAHAVDPEVQPLSRRRSCPGF